MGIPDPRPKSLFGKFSLKQKAYTKYTWPIRGGGFAFPDEIDSWQNRLLNSNRGGKSSNRRRPLTGTKTLWISPSAYFRSVMRYEDIQPVKADTYHVHPVGVEFYKTKEESPWFEGLQYFNPSFDNPEFWTDPLFDLRSRVSVNRRARLITECLLKIKDQKLDLSADLATAAQTFKMLASSAVTFYEALKAVRQRDISGVAKALGISKSIVSRRSASATYLEYIYGWKPLMQDIYGGWELLNTQLPQASLVHAVRKLSKTWRDSWDRKEIGYDYRWEIDAYMTGYDKLSLTGRISDSYARECARAGLINPLTVAWEVVPYSFLIDWGMPLGNVLEAMDATRGLSFVGGYLSSRSEGTYSFKQYALNLSDGGAVDWHTSQPGIGAIFVFTNEREQVSAWPFPEPYVKSPFSGGHLTNALALFRNMSRNRRI